MTGRVLFITYFYPPFNSVGALRASKMSRYLIELGWDVRVLTVRSSNLPATLPLEIPESQIDRTGEFDVNGLPRRILGRTRVASAGAPTAQWRFASLAEAYRQLANFPDAQIGWLPFAQRAAGDLVRRWRPHLVYSSALPRTAHLVAAHLRERYSVSWIAEFRDLWTDEWGYRRWGPLRALERRIESRCIERADSLVTVSDAWATTLSRRFPGTPVHVIPNGFDPRDVVRDTPPTSGPMVVVYTGIVYADRQTVAPLMGALHALKVRAHLGPSDLQVRFYGRMLQPIAAAAHAAGVDDMVEVLPVLPYPDALRAQQRAHALLLLGVMADPGCRPAKLYEYLAAGRPILAIDAADGETGRIVRRAEAGVVAATVEEVSRALEAWLHARRESGAIHHSPDVAYIAQFDRRAEAVALSELCSQMRATQETQAKLKPRPMPPLG